MASFYPHKTEFFTSIPGPCDTGQVNPLQSHLTSVRAQNSKQPTGTSCEIPELNGGLVSGKIMGNDWGIEENPTINQR